jgi:hypothetical protein
MRMEGDAALFARMAAFGLIVGLGYGILTGEPAGLVLLTAFGIASAVAAIAIAVGGRRAHPTRASDDGPAVDREPVPAPGWTPILLAIGLGGLGLGAVFGPWLGIAGLIVTLLAARTWLATAVHETDAARGRPDRREPD